MAENNIELIAANDLPTTEAEEVSVLCIDNGELKQKPGASFGGGGGYITTADSYDADSGMGTINENYDNFIDILLAGGSVWVDVTAISEAFGRGMVISWIYDAGTFGLICSLQGESVPFICPNGTWTPEV